MIWQNTVSAVLSCVLLAACVTTEPAKWVETEAEDARLLLYSPLFPEVTQERAINRDPQTGNRFEILDSSHRGYVFRAVLGNGGPGYVWKRSLTEPKSWLRDWAILKEAHIEVVDHAKIKGPLGPIDVWRITINGRQCATWNAYSGHDTENMFKTDRISGYFCARRGHDLTEAETDRTIKGFGIRGRQEPKASLRTR